MGTETCWVEKNIQVPWYSVIGRWYCAVLYQCRTHQNVGCDETLHRNKFWITFLVLTQKMLLYTVRKHGEFRLAADAVGWVVSAMHRGMQCVVCDEHAFL